MTLLRRQGQWSVIWAKYKVIATAAEAETSFRVSPKSERNLACSLCTAGLRDNSKTELLTIINQIKNFELANKRNVSRISE
jgi:hypothetical protein